jgi:hypothetical protein
MRRFLLFKNSINERKHFLLVQEELRSSILKDKKTDDELQNKNKNSFI